jgi:phosphoglycerate dehydrogenase-like enzyme
LCRAFGARVLANDIVDRADFFRAHGIEAATFEALLRDSDIVSLHTPLDQSTRGLVDARALALMKPTAFLVNTARGGIVDEAALKAALMEHRLAGAAADVFEVEPPADAELVQLPNFIGTPHVGGSTDDAVLAMGRAAIGGLEGASGAIDATSNV